MTPATLSALSLGYLFPAKERHVLQVHSAFQHALNLRSEGGQHLTLLCAEKYQNLADAARIILPERWDWRRETAGSGTIWLADGVLLARRFRVDLNAAMVWQPQLRRESLEPETCLWPQRHYRTLDSQLLLFCLEYEVESALQWQGNILQRGVRPQESPEQLEEQVPRLIGYGKGLTPDGDDYLLGYLAALWQWKLSPGLEAHYTRLQQAIERQLPHTTDISQHYLQGALQGHFSQAICELLKQLNADVPTTTIIACAEQVMQFGATSGVDCLAGLLHGMRTLYAHH